MAEKPDVVVSIDLGTTFTGGHPFLSRLNDVINDWPGSGDRGERKVPTTLVYNADDTLSSWGFMCTDDNETLPGKTRREFFKIFIDGATIAAAQRQGLLNAPKSTADAQRYATDYLREVYSHIKETIEMQIGRRHFGGGWANMAVSFLFSVPTTWTRMEIINIFKAIIRDAGFGIEGPKHTAQVDLTEAEAAAVATLKTSAIQFNAGSLFLTVDAGGGTTDLSLMRVTSTDMACPRMSQVSAVKGVGIGSTLIDRAFIRLVSQRLAAWPDVQSQLPTNLATRMAQSHHFRIVKHKFGEKVYMQPKFKIQVEGVSHDFSHPGIGIENGRMVFTMKEIQCLFDAQFEGVMKRVTEQLDWLLENGSSEQVNFIILSGGLGSSAYIRERMQRQLMAVPHPNATHAAVVPCQDPQLVVVRGLLLDHQQRMETGNLSVLATRVARASYGVVVKEAYSPAQHFNEDVIGDPFDSKKPWAINQIQWLIRKGDHIDPNRPLFKSFEFHLSEKDTTRCWDAEIVISLNEASALPSSLKQAGVTKLCHVRSNLNGVQQHQLILKRKKGAFFRKGSKFYICAFDIRVIVAPADLRFELWFDGQRFSGNHEPVGIKWDAAGAQVGSE
ncbi:Hsp70 family chaperone [Purpureocillium lilacinum]|uniref:Hsp70 family chaperone n=1 Tax=Purpureocillium lilacinum TaxID=33203 RepID=A0A179HVW7_PURLI|nr:Hsp70 family chaperone [Purpureocillium lilacinum]OAQ94032.1 Hsp70 family chaperone [Purpureocillium lilacinum]